MLKVLTSQTDMPSYFPTITGTFAGSSVHSRRTQESSQRSERNKMGLKMLFSRTAVNSSPNASETDICVKFCSALAWWFQRLSLLDPYKSRPTVMCSSGEQHPPPPFPRKHSSKLFLFACMSLSQTACGSLRKRGIKASRTAVEKESIIFQ